MKKPKRLSHEFHPEPLFFETTFADIPLERFLELDAWKGISPAGIFEEIPLRIEPKLSDAELDQFLDDLLDSPDLEITPPDMLMSVGIPVERQGHQ